MKQGQAEPVVLWTLVLSYLYYYIVHSMATYHRQKDVFKCYHPLYKHLFLKYSCRQFDPQLGEFLFVCL